MNYQLATVPKGIFSQLVSVPPPLYVLLIRGFNSRGDRFGISALCQRCQRSEKTIRRAITQGRSLGWIKSWRGNSERVVYSRHAPGPYVAVLDPIDFDPNETAHKVAMLVQLMDYSIDISGAVNLTGMRKSCVYSAINRLRSCGFIHLDGNKVSPSTLVAREINNLSILKKSMSRTSVPKPTTSGVNLRNRQLYDSWVDSGCPSIDGYELEDAAVIVMYRYSHLLELLENVRCAPSGTKIADVKVILRWLKCPKDFGFGEAETQRLLRVTNGRPFQTALMAVDSLFTRAFSGFTYDFNVLFKFTGDKNNFDRFVMGSYLKSMKRPEWRSELLNRINGDNQSESVETYEDFKSRLLGD